MSESEEDNTEPRRHFKGADIRALLTRPIAYHKLLAIAGGSVGAGVFLSQLVYWSERTEDPNGWVYKTLDDWWGETALSRFELSTIRKSLVYRKLIEEKLAGVPAKLFYRIVWDHLEDALPEAIQKHQEGGTKRLAKYPDKVPPKGSSKKAATKDVGIPQTGGNTPANKLSGIPQTGIGTLEDKPAKVSQTISQRVCTETTAENTKTKMAVVQTKAIPPTEEQSSSSFSVVVVEEKPEDVDEHTVERLGAEFHASKKQAQALAEYAERRGLPAAVALAEYARPFPKGEGIRRFWAAVQDNYTPSEKAANPQPEVKSAVEPEGWPDAYRRLALARYTGSKTRKSNPTGETCLAPSSSKC